MFLTDLFNFPASLERLALLTTLEKNLLTLDLGQPVQLLAIFGIAQEIGIEAIVEFGF